MLGLKVGLVKGFLFFFEKYHYFKGPSRRYVEFPEALTEEKNS